MKLYDVIVSGGGPAGSKCAEILAKSGFKVAILERDITWRKPCGGATGADIFEDYPQLRKINFQKVYKAELYSPDFDKIETTWKKEVYHIVADRLEFDNFTRNIAVDSGAELFDKNLSFDFITKNQQKVGIKTKTQTGVKEYYGKILIIADGMSSKLALKSGLRNKWKINEIGICKCEIKKSEIFTNKHTFHLFFRPFVGYGWIFPLGDKFINIGLGIVGEDILKHNLNQEFKRFTNENYIKKYFLSDSESSKLWSASYSLPMSGILEKSLYGENIMLIGDAAGFVSPANGAGINYGVRAGKISAETAIKALESEDITGKTLKKYKRNPEIREMIQKFKLYSSSNYVIELIIQNAKKFFQFVNQDKEVKKDLRDLIFFDTFPSNETLLKLQNL